MEWRTRHQWGAAPAKREPTSLDPSRVSDVFIHHTTGEGRADSAAWIRAIQRFHMDTRGWQDIGYSWIVDRYGVIWEARGNVVGAHTKAHNRTGLAIAYLGDGGRPVPPEALRSIRYLADNLARTYPITTVRGHRDVGSTACPGEWLYGWLRSGMLVPDPEPLPRPAPPVAPADAYQSPVPDLRDGWRRHLRRMRLR